MHNTTLDANLLETIELCPICGCRGELLYRGLRDGLLPNRSEAWNLYTSPQTGHAWLSPRYTTEAIYRAYEGYADTRGPAAVTLSSSAWKQAIKRPYFAVAHGYTAGTTLWQRLAGYMIALLLLPFKAMFDRQVMFLDYAQQGKLLDIGSGNGWFLQHMQWLGWEVEGIDLDPVSAAKARQRGVTVHVGMLEAQLFPGDSFNAITMTHVIEHLHDPVTTLAECFRILKPGGKIVIITPNIASLGHRAFGQSWQALDPPRHLNLFTLQSMQQAAQKAGFQIEKLYSSTFGAATIWQRSAAIVATGCYATGIPTGIVARLPAFMFHIRERLQLLWDGEAGEEIVLIGRK